MEGRLGQQRGWGSLLHLEWQLAKSALLVQPCLWSNRLHNLPSVLQTGVNDALRIPKLL